LFKKTEEKSKVQFTEIFSEFINIVAITNVFCVYKVVLSFYHQRNLLGL